MSETQVTEVIAIQTQPAPIIAPRMHVPMNDEDYALLVETLSIQSYTGEVSAMNKYIEKKAKKYGATVHEDNGNLYVTKGKADIFPGFVSHTDTVHKIIPDSDYAIYYYEDDPRHPLFAWDNKNDEPSGIGGDDKCGIFMCLVMLRDLEVCKCAFFRDEERGCIGSQLANISWFNDCAFVLQSDRRGNSDIIRNSGGVELYGAEFDAALKPLMVKYGYSNAMGTITDVRALKEIGLNVCAFNISSGYYAPHSDEEYVIADDVARTVALCKEVAEICGGYRWEHTYVKPVPKPYDYQKKWYRNDGSEGSESWDGIPYEEYGDYWGGANVYGLDRSASDGLQCPKCGRWVSLYVGWCNNCQQFIDELIKQKSLDLDGINSVGDLVLACPTCGKYETDLDTEVNWYWCYHCSHWFHPETYETWAGWTEEGDLDPPPLREVVEEEYRD